MKRSISIVLLLLASSSACDPEPAPEPEPEPETGACLEGFERIETESDCLPDGAPCYALDDESWCTGGCPPGTELDLSGEPACTSKTEECLEGFDLVELQSDCYADGPCYALDDESWCTGGCPPGTELDLSGEPACVPATPDCLEGFEVVQSESDCLADAVCYPDGGAFCTGECPEDSVFVMDETGVYCAEP